MLAMCFDRHGEAFRHCERSEAIPVIAIATSRLVASSSRLKAAPDSDKSPSMTIINRHNMAIFAITGADHDP
jgi:hypothetical protein